MWWTNNRIKSALDEILIGLIFLCVNQSSIVWSINSPNAGTKTKVKDDNSTLVLSFETTYDGPRPVTDTAIRQSERLKTLQTNTSEVPLGPHIISEDSKNELVSRTLKDAKDHAPDETTDDSEDGLITEAERMWENITTYKLSTAPKKLLESNSTSVVLITWFPWFETSTASSESEQISGVGTWREVMLSSRKESIGNVPGASALSVNSAMKLPFKTAVVAMSVYFFIFSKCLYS